MQIDEGLDWEVVTVTDERIAEPIEMLVPQDSTLSFPLTAIRVTLKRVKSEKDDPHGSVRFCAETEFGLHNSVVLNLPVIDMILFGMLKCGFGTYWLAQRFPCGVTDEIVDAKLLTLEGSVMMKAICDVLMCEHSYFIGYKKTITKEFGDEEAKMLHDGLELKLVKGRSITFQQMRIEARIPCNYCIKIEKEMKNQKK